MATSSRADEAGHIFPRTTAYYLLLQDVRIRERSFVFQFGIDVRHLFESGLRKCRAGPFGHIARHIVQAEVIGRKTGYTGRYQMAVSRIISLSGLEIAQETTPSCPQVFGTPGIFIVGIAHSGSIFPFGFSGQTEVVHDLSFRQANTFAEEFRPPRTERLSLFP